MCYDYAREAKRYVPEALNFLQAVLHCCSTSHGHLRVPLPSFATAAKASGFLRASL